MVLTPPVWWGRVPRAQIVSLFGIGLVAGGATTALALWVASGLLDWMPHEWRMAILSLIALVAVLRDAQLVRFRLPENARLVPRSVFDKGERVGTLQFGFEMGTGVRTFISATAPYVLSLGILLGGPGALASLAAGVGFGLGRWAMMVARLWSGGGRHWDHRLNACLGWLAPGMTALCGAVMLYAAAS